MKENYENIFLDKRNLYSNDLQGLHYVLLRLLKIVDYICQKHKIVYWLDSGTLLGAVRHKGFIPWDDDIDIVMPRKDYNKFIEAFNIEKPEEVFLQSKESDIYYKNDFIKIIDKKSKILNIKTEINGIFLDIFPLDEIKNDYFLKQIGSFVNKLANLPLYIDYKKAEKYKIFFAYLSRKIGRERLLKINDYLYLYMSKSQQKDSYIYGMENREWWNIWKKNKIYPLKKILFENNYFYAPNCLSYYLQELYGKDFMIEKKYANHFQNIILDVKKEKNEV